MGSYPNPTEVPDDEFGETQYAEADSPMKKEAAARRKWVPTAAMKQLDEQLMEEKTFDNIQV